MTARAVLVDRQIGLERTLAEHIDVLTRVFREVRRVLKPEGTVWLNYGDSNAATPNGSMHLTHDGRYKSIRDDRTHTDKPFSMLGGPLKAEDLSLASAAPGSADATCHAFWPLLVSPSSRPALRVRGQSGARWLRASYLGAGSKRHWDSDKTRSFGEV